jgi:uncharacterized membrane protein
MGGFEREMVMVEREQAKQRETTEDAPMADMRPYPGTPRWVKILGIILVVAILLFVVMHLAGGMGPGMHMP